MNAGCAITVGRAALPEKPAKAGRLPTDLPSAESACLLQRLRRRQTTQRFFAAMAGGAITVSPHQHFKFAEYAG